MAFLNYYLYPFFLGLAWGSSLLYLHFHSKNFFRWRFLFLILTLFFTAWVGSKLFFLIFSAQDLGYYLGNSSFWFGGGFVFYGGFLAAVATAVVWKVISTDSFPEFSFFPAALSLGHSIGRMGCTFSGCCYGREVEVMGLSFRIPVQLFEALFLLGMFFILDRQAKKVRNWQEIWFRYLAMYAGLRLFLEFWRGDYNRGTMLNGLITPGQGVSLIILLVVTVHYSWRRFSQRS